MLVGLISSADDEGRFLASTSAIAGFVFPHDHLAPRTIRQWRDEIAKAGVIRLYIVDGCEYGVFPNWKKHQNVNRPYPSNIPPPFSEGSVNGSVNPQ